MQLTTAIYYHRRDRYALSLWEQQRAVITSPEYLWNIRLITYFKSNVQQYYTFIRNVENCN